MNVVYVRFDKTLDYKAVVNSFYIKKFLETVFGEFPDMISPTKFKFDRDNLAEFIQLVMKHIIPKKLINKDNIFIDFDLETNSVNISFSDKITTIFSYWSKERVHWIIDDIHNELEEFFVHQPWNSITKEEIYHRIFTILDQVYFYGIRLQ